MKTDSHSHALVMPRGWDQYRTASGQVPGFARIRRVHLCDGRQNENRNSAAIESVKAGTYTITCPKCLSILGMKPPATDMATRTNTEGCA